MHADQISEQICKLLQPLEPHNLEITNFSHQHSRGDNTHYQVKIISDAFEGKTKIARHKMVYKLVTSLMPTPVHALMLETYSIKEASQTTATKKEPPPCHGGEK